MKSDLDLLISILEEEKKSLESAVNDGLLEHDYESVHLSGNALNKVEAQLYRLRYFKDPYFEAEERLQRFSKQLNIEDKSDEYISRFWKKQFEKELSKITGLTAKRTLLTDGQEIDNALFDLYACKYKKFILTLSHRGIPIQIVFTLDETKTLSITIDLSFIISYCDSDDPKEKQIHLFENLGFKREDTAGVMRYNYNMANFKSAWDIKIMLSRIIYDIGYFGEEKEGKIEFYE
ncbi:hypothetical protein A0256_19095 [Mucilaginibacter sp. PAMC 26640]|nr:hypothetical protein A0256_19095 [Mucilaginibacter sp. PAMC 26640]